MHAWLVHTTKLACMYAKPRMMQHADLSNLENLALSVEGI